MYEIQDLMGLQKGDQWEMRKDEKVVFRGGFKDVLRYAVHEHGFNLLDFERAVPSLLRGHNTLTFSAAKRLMHTSYVEPKKQKKVG